MSRNLGDTFYPHHPDESPAGDLCKNTRYTVGGDVFYQVVDDFDQDISWDILNEWSQSTSWDILNDFSQNVSWDILNAWAQATAWDILNDFDQDTSWHIHPAIINYIAQFIIKWIDTEFKIDQAKTDFKVCPVVSNFVVSSVIDDNVSIKESNISMSFSIVPAKYTFTLTRSLTSNFKIFRVMDNTRTP
jgi:hypothetical protein